MFWKLIKLDDAVLEALGFDLTTGEKTNPPKISELSIWRLGYFIKNLVDSEDPLSIWNHTTCPKHTDFHLIGLNDDGLGNKKLEVTIQIDRENKTLRFAMIEEIEN